MKQSLYKGASLFPRRPAHGAELGCGVLSEVPL